MALISIRDLELSFGGIRALDHITADIPDHGITGIIGPNGAGKTSLFNVISGLYRPSGGSVHFAGRTIHSLPFYKVNRLGIARTFQNLMVFDKLTVLQNVMIGFQSRSHASLLDCVLRTRRAVREREQVAERATALLELVGLDGHEADIAGGLPYGKQRQLDIARALATEPTVLLLDEPAAGLNRGERDNLKGILRRLAERGYVLCLIEHDMHFVMDLCHRIIVLNFGQLIAEGTPEQVQADTNVRTAYLGEV